MTSLGDVYGAQSRGMVDYRQLRFGMALFLGGIVAAFVGLLLATTSAGGLFGLDTFGARRVAGLLLGVAVPMALVGTIALFPASPRARATAAIGVGITALGIALFWTAYPSDWAGYGSDHTAIVSTVYALGTVTIAWALFSTVATFKRRNDPGGMIHFELAPTTGQPRLFAAAREGLRWAAGGAGGWFSTDDERPTVTAMEPDPPAVGRTDGGDAEVLAQRPAQHHPTDRYCGNCSHFTYATNREGRMAPYCRYHEKTMDDMEPCDRWRANTA